MTSIAFKHSALVKPLFGHVRPTGLRYFLSCITGGEAITSCPVVLSAEPTDAGQPIHAHSWIPAAASFLRCYCSSSIHSEAIGEARRNLHSCNSSQAAAGNNNLDVSKESEVLFDLCWRKMEERYGEDFWAPREIVWLNGAPGSGKGANTAHILKVRGLNRAVTVSSLLENNTAACAYMARGDMVPEVVVADSLLDAIFNPELADRLGVLIDGFPRTSLQVDFVKLLYEKLQNMHEKYVGTPFSDRFPRPSFKIIMLYVDETTSIQRQMQRAEMASQHNKRMLDAGGDGLREERATDLCVQKCKKRYDIFRTHYAALLDLKQQFPFTLIDAMCSVRGTANQISRELRYQSSMDLHESTYAALRHVPLARELVKSARQQLVLRLDSYCLRHPTMFAQVLNVIDADVLPVLRRCGLAGNAEFITEDPLFDHTPTAVDMLIDILTDRGFGVHHVRESYPLPVQFDMQTGAITTRMVTRHHFHISFNVKGLRELRVVKDSVSHTSLEPLPEYNITRSFIPEDEEQNQRVEALAKAHQEAVWHQRLQSGWLSSTKSRTSTVTRFNVASL